MAVEHGGAAPGGPFSRHVPDGDVADTRDGEAPAGRVECQVLDLGRVAADPCDAALLFFVWHHVVDRERGAQELRRVVEPGGKLFVQANFSDRMPDVWWFRVVPEWRSVDSAQFRSEEEVTRDFAGAGWTLVARDEVTWLRSANLSEDFERLKLRAVSVFEHLSAEAVEAGSAQIEAALPSLGDGPQYETSQLLVFQR